MSRNPSPAMAALRITLAVLLGGLVSVQSRINGELGSRLDDGYAAAGIAFGTGLLLLVIALVVSPAGRRGVARLRSAAFSRAIPVWHLFGGAAGALMVLGQTLTVAIIGVALFTVGVVVGQMLSSLVIDRTGMGTLDPRPLTIARVGGCVLALGSVILAVSSELDGEFPLWMLVLPFLAGIGAAWQQAVNGEVRAAADSAFVAAILNFTVGTVVVVVAFLIHTSVVGPPAALPAEPFLYLGGPMGVLVIGSSAVLVRYIGVLVIGLAMTAGQLVGALLLDLYLPAPGHVIVWTTIAGTVLTLLAVGIAALPGREVRRR